MKTISQTVFILAALSPLLSVWANGQAVAAAAAPAQAPYTGFELPSVPGSLTYSVSASEIFTFGYNASNVNVAATSFSGNLGYLSGSSRHPFSAVYTGGYFVPTSGQPNQVYQSLALSQVLTFGKTTFILSDAVSYLPEAATSGLSGIPGLGDANLPPISITSYANQDIFSNYSRRVDNTLSATAERQITGSTSISASGSQSILRLLDIPGTESTDVNAYSATGGVQHRLNARNTVGADYSYSESTYTGFGLSSVSQGVNGSFSRQLNRNASFSISAGPQRTSTNDPALIPTRTRLSVGAVLQYSGGRTTENFSYSRATGTGSGLVAGSETDSVRFGVGRQFGRSLSVSGQVGYLKSESLIPGALDTSGIVAGVQANRSITERLSGFVSYTLERQIAQGNSISSLALNGVVQTLGFGITYAPAALHFNRH